MYTLVTIKTIGYGGMRPEDFFAELESLKPGLVVDVRENPFKAFLGAYTKPQLEKRLGHRYVWVRELGNASRSTPPVLVDEAKGLERLRELAEAQDVVVLLCAEREEARCHRCYVKEKISRIV